MIRITKKKIIIFFKLNLSHIIRLMCLPNTIIDFFCLNQPSSKPKISHIMGIELLT